jgi:hypothetical protein
MQDSLDGVVLEEGDPDSDPNLVPVTGKKKASAKTKEPKPKKQPKGPSEFELVRSILQRTSERKLHSLVRNIGTAPDTITLCGSNEDNITFGSWSFSLGIIHIDSPTLRESVESVLRKLVGYDHQDPCTLNLRDQISELAKSKGEAISCDLTTLDDGSVGVTKVNKLGRESFVPFMLPMKSLYHYQCVEAMSQTYAKLLIEDNPAVLKIPYTVGDTGTYHLNTLDLSVHVEHPIAKQFPKGIRLLQVRGLDVVTTPFFRKLHEYPITEELLIVELSRGCFQAAHRVIGDGWRILIVRPYMKFPSTTFRDAANPKEHQL